MTARHRALRGSRRVLNRSTPRRDVLPLWARCQQPRPYRARKECPAARCAKRHCCGPRASRRCSRMAAQRLAGHLDMLTRTFASGYVLEGVPGRGNSRCEADPSQGRAGMHAHASRVLNGSTHGPRAGPLHGLPTHDAFPADATSRAVGLHSWIRGGWPSHACPESFAPGSRSRSVGVFTNF